MIHLDMFSTLISDSKNMSSISLLQLYSVIDHFANCSIYE